MTAPASIASIYVLDSRSIAIVTVIKSQYTTGQFLFILINDSRRREVTVVSLPITTDKLHRPTPRMPRGHLSNLASGINSIVACADLWGRVGRVGHVRLPFKSMMRELYGPDQALGDGTLITL